MQEFNIILDGKENKQVNGFVYLGGMVKTDGQLNVAMRLCVQAEENAWADEFRKPKLKGKVSRAYVHTGTGDSGNHKAGNNWVRKAIRK